MLWEEAVRRLEEARTLTRSCLRDAEPFAKTVAALLANGTRGSVPQTLGRLDRAVRKLDDLVSTARTRSKIAIADEKRLAAFHAEAAGDASRAVTSPEEIAEHWNMQKSFVKDVRQAVSRLEASLLAVRSYRDRLLAERNVTKANKALDRANIVVARATGHLDKWKPPPRGSRD